MRLAPCLLYNLGDIATRAAQPKANKQVTVAKKVTKDGKDKLTVMSSLYIEANSTKGTVFAKVALKQNQKPKFGFVLRDKTNVTGQTSSSFFCLFLFK
jgi:hypothetical protein